MSQIAYLYNLQQTDTQILQGKTRLAEILNLLKEPTELLASRAQVESINTTIKGWQDKQKELNTEIQNIVNKSKQAENRLYSGKVQNPKELSDLQMKIDSLGRRKTELEDQVLETMITIEETENKKAEINEQLQQLEEKWLVTFAALENEKMEVASHVNQLIAGRNDQLKLISPDYLSKYETLQKKKRNGVAVAGLRHNLCRSCQVTVSAQVVKLAKEGLLAYCDSCGRILNPV